MPKKRINIWIINQYAVPPSMFGGTRHFDIAKELSKKNIETKIFASSFNNNSRKETINYNKSCFVKKAYRKIEFLWIKSRPYKSNGLSRMLNMVTFCLNLYKAMKIVGNKNQKPDVIVGSSPQLLAAYTSLLYAKKNNIKFIFEIRDIWPLSLIDLGKSKSNPIIILFSIIERKLVLKADKIIVLMHRGKQYLTEKFKIPSQKTVWISNGVNLDSFPTNQYAKTSKPFLIRYTGTIGEANDLGTVVEAAKILQRKKVGIKIELFGDGVMKKSIEKQITEYKLRNISIERPVTKKYLFKILETSDALLFTLKKADVFKYGNPPNKIFDYLASSRPIVFSSCASNNLISQSKSGISVAPGRPALLAKAIIKMSEMPITKRVAMGRRARVFVENGYQMINLSDKFNTVIKELLNDL